MKYLWAAILVWVSTTAFAQTTFRTTVVDSLSGAAVPYATAYNLRSGSGTVSDERGRLVLENNRLGDSIRIAYLGYRDEVRIVGAISAD